MLNVCILVDFFFFGSFWIFNTYNDRLFSFSDDCEHISSLHIILFSGFIFYSVVMVLRSCLFLLNLVEMAIY